MTWRQSSDQELWVLGGGTWKFPVLCTAGLVEGIAGTVWRCCVARPLVAPLLRAVPDMLEQLSCGSIRDVYFVQHERFLRAFEKCPGITPDYYLEFDGHRRGDPVPMRFERTRSLANTAPPGSDGFIRAVWSKSKIEDLATFKIVWNAICREMPHWMMAKQNSLDLGWAKIQALPFRANWKQILLAKYPLVWRFLKIKKDIETLFLGKFYTDFTRTDLLSVNRTEPNPSIGWTLEISPTNEWNELSSAHESRISKLMSPEQYTARVSEIVADSWLPAMESFRSFVESTNSPCGDIVEDSLGRDPKLVARLWHDSVSRTPDQNIDVAVVSPQAAPCLRGITNQTSRQAAKDHLREMPSVGFEAGGQDDTQLRRTRGDDHWDEYAAGLLV